MVLLSKGIGSIAPAGWKARQAGGHHVKQSTQTQKGQIIVLFALILVGLIAFAGLAIDGAMVYSDRRFDQSSADGAALAGAGAAGNTMQMRDIFFFRDFNCSDFNTSGTKMNAVKHDAIDATIARAGANSVSLDNDISDHHGVVVRCVNNGNAWQNRYIEVEVQITSVTDTSFSQIVNDAPLQNTVTAIARVYPPTTAGYGNAIVSTDKDSCGTSSDKGGIEFGGGIDVNITGGGIFSSSCITGNGANHVIAQGPGVTYMTTYDPPTGSGAYILPAPQPTIEELPPMTIEIPQCSSAPAVKINSSANITPGNYSSITIQNNEILTMAPGLYCLTGNFSISGSATVTGTGVTIYMQKKGANQYSNFSVTGTGAVNLTAPSSFGPDPSPAIRGVLIRFAEDNDNGIVTLQGSGAGTFGGTIYAPDSEIKIGGTSNTGTSQTLYNTELIGDRVTVSGNTTININYQNNQFSLRAAWLTLMK